MTPTPIRRLAAALAEAPFECTIGVACVCSGLVQLGPTASASESVHAALPRWLQLLWGIYLLLGGLLIVSGVLTRARVAHLRLGYRLESLGLTLLGPAVVIFSVAVLGTGVRLAALYSVAVSFAVGVACAVRVVTIRSILNRLTQAGTR